MIRQYYERKFTRKGSYRAGRNCLYLWFAIIGVLCAICLPLTHFLTEDNYTLTAKGIIYIAAMLIAAAFALREHFKIPASSLTIDSSGIQFSGSPLIRWDGVQNVSVTDTQLSAPYGKNFNVISARNKFLNIQHKDGSFATYCLDSLSFNPLALLVAINVFSHHDYCDAKGEERSFAKLMWLLVVAITAIIIYCIYTSVS